jgi:hypothetical protein
MSIAGVEARAGSAAMAACSRAVTAHPMENSLCTQCFRNERMWARNASDDPAPSARSSTG